ncbi:MAG TPA: Txe/YoeB family addiction module toxin [Hanamia sp.]
MRYGNRIFTRSKNDIAFWKRSGNIVVLKKIRTLLENIQETPYHGLGKPESLKFELAGKWSRRINHEHRLVYEVLSDKIIIHSLRGHYD